jgi:cytochrome c peroxidase
MRIECKVWKGRSAWKISAGLFLVALVLTTRSNLAQGTGDVIRDNSGYIPFQQSFFAFEVEQPIESLKDTAIWNELEAMLDNPYAFVLDPTVGGNVQGWPAYRMAQPRRRSFVFRNGAGQPCAPGSAGCTEVPLEGLIIHPLNYNHMNGEELRLLNINFEGAEWIIPDQLILVDAATNKYEWIYKAITVSPGEGRIEDDEAAIDFNSPFGADTPTCIRTTEFSFTGPAGEFFSTGPASGVDPAPVRLPEGIIMCGGDPGEPGYAGFGVLLDAAEQGEQYSVPALPGVFSPADPIPTTARLFDPARGFIEPRVDGTPGDINHGLRRPSLRVFPYGTPAHPNYLVNSEASLADDPGALVASNENDYYKGATRAAKETARLEAAALGKALFWDMQVGSDAVQACASCHFNAGADNRTKNQTNPNHLGGDFTLQLHGGVQNSDLVATDFPFQKVPDTPNDPGNGFGNVNDVASSMGVRFRQFTDIKAPGAASFSSCSAPLPAGVTATTCVRTLLPDEGIAAADPIPVFQDLRRVEPRNTPTLFNADMNFDNFWDGRARHDFNGGSVFGPSDPQAHVMVSTTAGTLEPTRQIIRFVSLASLATGPALSEFEMSFLGRNWAKLGKKLLQGAGIGRGLVGSVTPLANQLVDPNDSVLGRYSNQGGSACPALPAVDRVLPVGSRTPPAIAPGRPGLCISYPGLIRRAFYEELWQNASAHLDGCYTDGNTAIHPNQCAPGTVTIPVLSNGAVVDGSSDPFDGYVLSIAAGTPVPSNTNQFSQIEANMSLFFGLSIHAWGAMLVTDDTPFDRFMDANPDAFKTFGESDEPNLALDLLRCDQTGGRQPCFTEVGNFKRDPGLFAKIDCVATNQCTSVESGGTRTPGSPDPLMGADFFLGSNMSLKNPNFKSLRCGECHTAGTLTDMTFEVSHQTNFGDFIQEFRTGTPGIELFPEPLGRSRTISGFALEGELSENAQDAIERNAADFCAVEPCVDAYGQPVPGGVNGGFPQGQALFDNGVYNIGVTPIANDIMRGGTDPFGWPLSLSRLALKNLGGVDYTPGGDDPANGFAQPGSPLNRGNPLPTFDLAEDPTSGGIFEPSPQDQQINPGFGEEPCPVEVINEAGEPECVGMLPPYLAPWASNVPVGDETNQDELFIALNTVMREPMLEGFVDNFGPFNPAAVIGESFNYARQPEMSTWPNANRVNAQGSVKAPSLRNVALTGPYFHNGGKLTLRQVLDFYTRGGDFPKMNSQHRDFLIVNLLQEDEALGGVDPLTGETEFTAAEKEQILVSVIDFLLELTDERVAFQRAPFDQVEIFPPLDGRAPDNGSLAGTSPAGRQGFVNNTFGINGGVAGMFKHVPASGQGGIAIPIGNFLGVTNNRNADCATEISHYCR